MNSHQRDAVDRLLGDYYCQCYDEFAPDLPKEILDAAGKGHIIRIKDYIAKDGNVNSLLDDECLLSRACAEGQVVVVKLLLQCPEIHLNFEYNGLTPLDRASRNGHMECLRLLLDAPVNCKICLDKSWKAVARCLEMYPQLQYKSAIYVLSYALHRGHWFVVQPLLEMNHHYMKEQLYPLVLVAVSHNRWDIVHSVLKKDICGKNRLINEVFAITVNMRDWDRVQDILHFIDSSYKFDVPFVEAALAGRLPEAQRLLSENQYDSETLNGNLLVVAAGGTTDPVAELLMSVKGVYSQKTFSTALFLEALEYHGTLIQRLLYCPEASYGVHDLDEAHEVITRQSAYQGRGDFLITYFKSALESLPSCVDEKI